ncbi:MAG: aminotransferase class I/II-fold pyridoxal phosphate-dependent enzyme [Micrococcaceae bacterium]
MKENFRHREEINAIPSYVAGKPASNEGYKMSSNENAFGPLPQAIEALHQETDYYLYPEPFAHSLREALAKFHSIDSNKILTGCGGLSIIYQVFDAFCTDTEHEIIYAWRSFEAYPIAATSANATVREIPLTVTGDHDLETMLKAVNDKTRLIVLCSPNNPTGTIITKTDFENFMDKVPSDIPVLLDEAYYEFVDDETAVRGDQYLAKYQNLMCLRTFSKAYGLAGLRVGYLLTSPELATYLGKISRVFEVSSAALTAAKTSLKHHKLAMERINKIIKMREDLSAKIENTPWQKYLTKSQGNFIWLQLDENTSNFVNHLTNFNISARPFPEGVRVTVATAEANAKFLEALTTFRYN